MYLFPFVHAQILEILQISGFWLYNVNFLLILRPEMQIPVYNLVLKHFQFVFLQQTKQYVKYYSFACLVIVILVMTQKGRSF